jgi:hypothetical protein
LPPPGRTRPPTPVCRSRTARTSLAYTHGAYSQFGLRPQGELRASNWDLLSDLRDLPVTADTGLEMYVADNGLAQTLGIDGYFADGHFECVVGPSAMTKGRWVTRR